VPTFIRKIPDLYEGSMDKIVVHTTFIRKIPDLYEGSMDKIVVQSPLGELHGKRISGTMGQQMDFYRISLEVILPK